MSKIFSVTVSSPEFKTVQDFLDDPYSAGFKYSNRPDYFLDNIIDENKLTNRGIIENTLKKTVEGKKFLGKKADQLPLPRGIALYIEENAINEPSVAAEGIEVVTNNEPAFKAAKLAELESDKGYELISNEVSEIYPDLTVWAWVRSLTPNKLSEDTLTGQMLDLTPFIEKCNTYVGKNGGKFQISLPPLICELENERWVIKKNTFIQYEKTNSLQGVEYVSDGLMFEGESRNQFYLHNTLQANDLIFIRFETLKLEADERYEDANNLHIDKKNIAGRNYDMIGLIDSNSINIDPQSNNVSIDISGRDLSKLFLEDGTYFYALENSEGVPKIAGGTRIKSSLIDRSFSDGGLYFLNLYNQTSIEYILKFVIQQLSNISVVPNDLFTSYGDRVNTRFDVTTLEKPESKYKIKKEEANGIWKIVKLVIDESVTNRRVSDTSLSQANGALLNFIRSCCQEPLVEFFMDTYGDVFYLTVRKPPYDQKAIISLLNGQTNNEGKEKFNPSIINIKMKDVIREDLTMDDSQVYSWYQFHPKGTSLNSLYDYTTQTLPAVYFDEYAEVFGAKAFSKTHNYIPYLGLRKNSDLDVFEEQAYYDLKYVIESSQYLPFTRKGTIVINGDKRIKLGNIIRYEATGEIFFVDNVQQSFFISDRSIERITIVTVSRGMVEQLIYGIQYLNKDGQPKIVSYFNIINTELNLDLKKVNKKVPKTVSKEEIKQVPVSQKFINQWDNLSDYFKISKGNTGIKYLESYNDYPQNKLLFINFISRINELGYSVVILPSAVNRTFEQQRIMHLQDSRNAKAGNSRHEVGKAIDITIVNKKTGEVYTKNTSESKWRSTGVPQLAQSMGLQWGDKRNIGQFGTYIDRVHFEIAEGYTEEKVTTTETVEENVSVMEIDRDNVFSNFKVDKFVFNFFLKRLQFSEDYKKVTSRDYFRPDGSLPEVIIKSKK